MPEPATPMTTEQMAAMRRRGVRRTALVFAILALVVYVAFLLSGVLPR